MQYIGQEYEPSSFGIPISNPAQSLWITLLGIEHRQFSQLIADPAAGSIHRQGIEAPELGIGFQARDKKAALLLASIKRVLWRRPNRGSEGRVNPSPNGPVSGDPCRIGWFYLPGPQRAALRVPDTHASPHRPSPGRRQRTVLHVLRTSAAPSQGRLGRLQRPLLRV